MSVIVTRVGKRDVLTYGNCTAITVRELIAALKKLKQNAWVLTAIDAEGNGYNLIENRMFLGYAAIEPGKHMRDVESENDDMPKEANAIILHTCDGRGDKEFRFDYSECEEQLAREPA